MNRTQRTIASILVLILIIPGFASATKKGRLIGKVLDPDGQPIPGVKVTATCKEISRVDEEEITDKKGVFKLDFDYLGVVYQLRFEKDGYYPLESEQDWDLVGTAREEFTLYPGQEAVASAPIASSSNMAVHNFNQGVEAYNTKDYETAAAEFEEALKHDPEMHHAWAALSTIYLKQERYQEVVETAEKAIELGSTDQSVWRTRWEAYRNLGDEAKADQALLDLEDAGIRAEEAKRIHNEAVALVKAGNSEAAFVKFQEALELDPNLLPALLGLATAATQIGKDAEAASAAENILNADPTHEAALRIRYNAALNLGDDELIIDALVGLAPIEPEIARNSLLTLAFDAYEADDMERATARFLKVVEVDPSNAKCHYYLGLIYVNEGANENALAHLKQFVEMAPDDPDAATASDLVSYLSGSS